MNRSAGPACGFVDNASALPTAPQAHHHQPGRTYHPLQKPDIFTRYRQAIRAGVVPAGSRIVSTTDGNALRFVANLPSR